MGLLKELKEFAVKGNAMDMAIGIIIGAAFGKIITSLVNDVIMPPVGLLLGGVDFKALAVTLKAGTLDPVTKEFLVPPVELRYGLFVNTALDFLIVAVCLFAVVKVMNMARRLGSRDADTEPPKA
jgi:large conductance mechanosensitive channel